ncbi:FliA/WhiG family RNA polymerase sigma factor [Sporosarcina sp. HYO08]|uniref:FliA/WhiG family RNA polymerase sigma factor n=1 Tax=Sporosarcina sp. HYO08 TaxID=1759557 RepID=UPI0007952C01|nr:FliA/WhiG family RNA polymerase sigma factor [Sporosarcina sp. HYO08]KXH80005.1 RNA polymerase subunit sigma [Sporosarcina sp. HYO08]
MELTEDACWKLWIHNRDSEAGDFLARKYTPLVTYHVQRIGSGLPANISRSELMSLGYQGLFDALTKFDPSRDLKFDTYASFRIRGSIIDGLRKEDWLPRSLREKSKRLEEEKMKLEQQLMRHATVYEIADHMNVSSEEVEQTIQEQYFSNVLSVDEQINEGSEDDPKTFVIEDEHEKTPEQQLVMDELVGDLAIMIERLTENEQIVLNLFYSDEMTLTEIGEILSLSTSRISQIHSKALTKLRKMLAPEVIGGRVI